MSEDAQHVTSRILEFAPSTVTLLLLILGLFVVHRFLLKAHTASTGKKFRNQVIMLGLSAAGALLMLLTMPVDPVLRGQVLSLLGIVLSAGIALSSTTLLGNAMAGFMIRAVRAFRLGEFIQLGEHFGRVSDMGLFHVEIQTEDRDLKTLPNLLFITNAVKRIRPSGTILSASLSLGYDVPSSQIRKLLTQAADDTGLKDPFTRVVDLGDHAVTYKVAGLLEDVSKLLVKRSDLRIAMMHRLHEAGIEVVSPRFRNTRLLKQGQVFIPPVEEDQASAEPEHERESVVFDKAEEAASLESLRQAFEELEKQKQALLSTKAEGSSDRGTVEADELARVETRLERLAKVIEARQNRATEND